MGLFIRRADVAGVVRLNGLTRRGERGWMGRRDGVGNGRQGLSEGRMDALSE